MTSVAMIAGMFPVAMGMAGNAEFQSQMAIAVIGGLVTSTALTLMMVPAGFTVMDDMERWLGRKIGRHLVNDEPHQMPAPAGAPQQHPAG